MGHVSMLSCRSKGIPIYKQIGFNRRTKQHDNVVWYTLFVYILKGGLALNHDFSFKHNGIPSTEDLNTKYGIP
jgi:hypothetical protein